MKTRKMTTLAASIVAGSLFMASIPASADTHGPLYQLKVKNVSNEGVRVHIHGKTSYLPRGKSLSYRLPGSHKVCITTPLGIRGQENQRLKKCYRTLKDRATVITCRMATPFKAGDDDVVRCTTLPIKYGSLR